MKDVKFPSVKEEIEIKCSYQELKHISLLEPTQGELKKSSQIDLDKLSTSLRKHGYIRPIILWWDMTTDQPTNKILDGHQRLGLHLMEAKKGIGTKDYKVPVIYAKADTYEDAMKVLLQLISTTGEINISGLHDFAQNNKFNLDELVASMSLKSPSLKKVQRQLDEKQTATLQLKPEFPIQKEFNEAHNAVIVFCDNEKDWLWLQTKLELNKTKDPNSKYVGKTKVVHVSELQKLIEDDK